MTNKTRFWIVVIGIAIVLLLILVTDGEFARVFMIMLHYLLRGLTFVSSI